MVPERFPPDDPREWLNRAKSNLIQAKSEKPGVYWEDLCFQAQQAAEKSVKALLLHRGLRFPYVHDLAELIELLEQQGESIPSGIREVARLTNYAVEARYPGLAEPVTREEYKMAVVLAEEVVRWVEKALEGHGEEPSKR
ncbi:MAG: HEPN domain-containing protein [Anaerolineae bacterium]